jgi:ATP-dependent Lon protease
MRLAIIPAGNVPELSEIPEHVRARLRIEPVRSMEEVLPLALARPLPRPARKSSPEKPPPAAAPGRGSPPSHPLTAR